MKKNRISRTTPKNTSKKISPNTHPQLFIDRSEITFEPKTEYIESILAVLCESRFGPLYIYEESPDVVHPGDHPQLELLDLSDLLDDDGLLPFYVLWNARVRTGSSSDRIPGPRPSGTHNSTTALTPNQGRGSP